MQRTCTKRSLVQLENEDPASAFMSEAKLEKLGKNYLDFIASAESRFPLLFGREARIRKFKKFKAAKLEYQEGARGGKYSELGTKKDILNKLSQNKLLERRLKKELLKKNGRFGINVLWQSEGSRRGVLKRNQKSSIGFRSSERFRRQHSRPGQIPFRVTKMHTEQMGSSGRAWSVRRSLKRSEKSKENVAVWGRRSYRKENSCRGNGEKAKKYQIKKSKSNFFLKKKKVHLKSEACGKKKGNSVLASYLRIKRLKSQN